MSSTRKCFTCPTPLWTDFSEFLEIHPEINMSGWIQKQIQLLLDRNKYLKCKFFEGGYCMTDSSINECSLLKLGFCILDVPKKVKESQKLKETGE